MSDEEIQSINDSAIKYSDSQPISSDGNNRSTSRSLSKFFKSIFYSNFPLNKSSSNVEDIRNKYGDEGNNTENSSSMTSLKVDKR
uniref:Uncharacterized protein n=1 Tax=Strongyloides papillosus TaxID=174720 RepID=A0A0N5B6C7_STREA